MPPRLDSKWVLAWAGAGGLCFSFHHVLGWQPLSCDSSGRIPSVVFHITPTAVYNHALRAVIPGSVLTTSSLWPLVVMSTPIPCSTSWWWCSPSFEALGSLILPSPLSTHLCSVTLNPLQLEGGQGGLSPPGVQVRRTRQSSPSPWDSPKLWGFHWVLVSPLGLILRQVHTD